MNDSTEELLELIRLTERISADIHGLRDEADILNTVASAFRNSDPFHTQIILLDEKTGDLRVAATSFSQTMVKLGEKVIGVSMKTFRVNSDKTPLMARVLRGGETIQVSTTETLADLVPARFAKRALRAIRYGDTEDILTPLHIHGRPMGVLSVTAPGLAEHFIPSLKTLARHLGAAFELADAIKEIENVRTQYRDLVENLNEIIYTVDMTGRITYISPNVSCFGYTPDELLGTSFAQVFEAEDIAAAQAQFDRFLSGQVASSPSEFHLRGKDGTLHWIRFSSRLVLEDGQPVGVQGSLIDVTQEKAAEEALRESERILNQTGRMAKIGGWEHDLETGEAIWTEELYGIFGIELSEEPPGTQEHLSYYPPEDRARLEEAYNRAVEDGTPFDLELRCHTATGKLLWFRATGESVVENGKCVKMRGTFQDINDRKLAELAKAESERQLSTLMSNLPGMVYRCQNERDWPMEFVSEGSRIVTGYEPEDLIGSRVIAYGSLVHPEDRDRIWDEVQDAVSRCRPFESEYRVIAADGTGKWVREQGRAVQSEDGEVIALEGFISDVTEQHRAEQALRQNEERLAMAVETTSDGLWDWNALTGETYFSPRCYTMLGFEPYEFPAEYDEWRSIIHSDDRDRAIRQFQKHVADRDDTFEIELRMKAKDSAWCWILNRGRVADRDAEGRPSRLVGTLADITARVESANALQRALDGTIRVVVRMAEARDPYTAGHQERVSLLACAIAREMGHFDTMGEVLRVAGLLHDVGKIAVPSEILSKPTHLSEAEMQLVRGHAEASYQILEGIDFPWPIGELIRQHHERLDGTGYPRGLRGDAICLGARILAVADVVEAMASHRPYRPALGIDAALTEIERVRGSELDPDAVDACVRLFRERGLTLETLSAENCAPEIR